MLGDAQEPTGSKHAHATDGIIRNIGIDHNKDHVAFRKRLEQVTARNIAHILHRLGILLCAIMYLLIAFKACSTTIYLMRGRDNPTADLSSDKFDLAGAWLGTSTLYNSPLVTTVLKNSTIPMGGTVYLEAELNASFSFCRGIDGVSSGIYTDAFQRTVFAAITSNRTRSRNIDGANIELIVPIVDCANTILEADDATCARFFFLVRDRLDPSSLALVVVSMSNQQYFLVEQRETGPAAIATVQIVNSMNISLEVVSSANPGDAAYAYFLVSLGYPYEPFDFEEYAFINVTDTGMWTLLSDDDDGGLRKVVQTACKSGIFIKAETEQANLSYWLWAFPTDPWTAVTEWPWLGTPVFRDSWAWVHGLHLFIGLRMLVSLLILLVATYHNFASGHLWIGDAFVDISSQQVLRGLLVLLSWYTNAFWSLQEFCILDSYRLFGLDGFFVNAASMHADLVTLFFGGCGIIGWMTRERIDPFVALFVFEMAYKYRNVLNQWYLPMWRSFLETTTTDMYWQGNLLAVDGQASISPMLFTTTVMLEDRNWKYICAMLFSMFSPIVLIVAFAVGKKGYRRCKRDVAQKYSPSAQPPRNRGWSLKTKRVLTQFEIATGAELENRFGLVCEYERNIFFKGLKFASADGIYSNGFLIANGKYLVQTSDIWAIVVMKLVRKRLWNVFVHELAGTSVRPHALLVYPDTISFVDLLHLNVTPLT